MDRNLGEIWLILVLPTAIGFALPKILRRPLSLISIVIFVISLFGQGVHDDHFIVYLCNVLFLIGSIARECVNFVFRMVRVQTAKQSG